MLLFWLVFFKRSYRLKSLLQMQLAVLLSCLSELCSLFVFSCVYLLSVRFCKVFFFILAMSFGTHVEPYYSLGSACGHLQFFPSEI